MPSNGPHGHTVAKKAMDGGVEIGFYLLVGVVKGAAREGFAASFALKAADLLVVVTNSKKAFSNNF